MLDSPSQITIWLAIAAGLAAVGAGGALLWRRATAVKREVERALRELGHEAVRGVVLPDGVDGPVYIECVLVGTRALAVLDLRDVRGAVFGAEKMDDWTVLDGVKRFTFRNPLIALHDRVLALRHHLGDEVEVHGFIVFSPRASFPKGLPPRSLPLRALGQELGGLLGVRDAPVAPQVEQVRAALRALGTGAAG